MDQIRCDVVSFQGFDSGWIHYPAGIVPVPGTAKQTPDQYRSGVCTRPSASLALGCTEFRKPGNQPLKLSRMSTAS